MRAADHSHEIACLPQRGNVGELEPVLKLDAPRAEVAQAPAVGEACAPGVEGHAVEAEVVQDGADGEAEAMAHNHRHPAVCAGPVVESIEAFARPGRFADEGEKLFWRCFHAGERGLEGMDARCLSVRVGLLWLAGSEPLQEQGGQVLLHDDVVEVQAKHRGHCPRIDDGWRRSTTLGPMDVSRARYLVSDRGRAALAALPVEHGQLDPVRLSSLLRRTFPGNEAAALGEQVTLRTKAAARLGNGSSLLFTAEGLEMMTHPAVAARRAARLAALGLPVADLTCGIGGDLGACSEAGLRAVGIERDAGTTLLAAANVPGAAVVRGDAARPPLDLGGMAVIVDPSRRGGTGRRFDPAAFSPSWDVAMSLLASAKAGVLKAPPGIEAQHLPQGAEVEYVQLGRSMREAAIWVGAGATAGVRRAVLLPVGASLDSGAPEAPADVSQVGAFVFDPESCVTLAGLVRHLAHRLGARLIDERVAYLTADAPAFDPLCATFEVLDVVPFSVERVRERLRARGWAPMEIRRRAFPVEPDELRRLLGRIEGEQVTLLCTTVRGKRTVVVGRKLVAREEKCERG